MSGGPGPYRSMLIVGTGALATFHAWRLVRAGYDVTMLGTWQPALDALRKQGARLVDIHGSERGVAVHVVDDSRELKGIKNAIVLVKSWQTETVARQLRECLAADGVALTLQNGLGNYEILEQSLGSERVAIGSTTMGATLLGPGLVKPAGEGSISVQSHPRLESLQEALRAAGFDLHEVPEAGPLLWGKLVVNSAINPLTALLRVPNGELLNRPVARMLMRRLAQETAAVAAAEHISLPFDDPPAHVEEVARRTAANYSSMLQDIRRGAPTEIEAICGAVARIGQQDGIPTPMNEACWQLIRAAAETPEILTEATS